MILLEYSAYNENTRIQLVRCTLLLGARMRVLYISIKHITGNAAMTNTSNLEVIVYKYYADTEHAM